MTVDSGVKEQSVSLIELFYDLVYVYAIASMTSILTPGGIDAYAFARYFAASFIVLQAWMYMTNYVNRFGRTRWYENLAIAVNMMSTVFLSNAISAQWETMYLPFNISLLVNLGTVFVLYALRSREGGNARATAHYSMKSLAPALVIYSFVAFVGGILPAGLTFALDGAAILFGIFLPAFIRTKFDTSIIGFPHLTERFELLTIITFGEAVVTVAEFFQRFSFGVESTLVFCVIITLFGAYVVQMHNLVEHHARQRGLLLIYSHFFLVICINLFTVCLNVVVEEGHADALSCALAAVSLAGFFVCLFANSVYYRDGVRFALRDAVTYGAIVLVGTVVMLAPSESAVLLLAGSLVSSGGCFAVLLARDKGVLRA